MSQIEILEDKYENDNEIDKYSINTSTTVTPGVYYPKNKIHRQRSARPKSKRAVFKNGQFNIEKWKHNKKSNCFTTWFITMVEARWRWTLIQFTAAFIADWVFFGFLYWIIALHHGDLTDDHFPPNQNATQWTPCVKNIYGFTSTLLFSIEVHTTVAYGRRAITLDCPQTIITMCLQCIISSIFQAFMIGILFAKLTRPKSRTQTILFSKQAVVNLRDDKLCLIFRVGDIRKSKILNIKTSVYVIRLDFNNVVNDFEQIELEVIIDGCESSFFLWPISVTHVIDETSPLYKVSAADLLCGKIEILTVFEGIIESTGQPVQAITSYNTYDILWGHRFLPMVSSDNEKDVFEVDFSKLCETEQIDTPLCSADEYNSVMKYFDSESVQETENK